MASTQKPAPSSTVPAGPAGSFDERLARLEAIVAELENGEIALEPAIARYQEGIELLKGCRGLLEGFQKQVEELSAGAEGGVSAYSGDPDLEHETARRLPRVS